MTRIYSHRTGAMAKIQNLLRESKIGDAIALLRASRDVWPEGDVFGAAEVQPDEELLILREIFHADLSSGKSSSNSSARPRTRQGHLIIYSFFSHKVFASSGNRWKLRRVSGVFISSGSFSMCLFSLGEMVPNSLRKLDHGFLTEVALRSFFYLCVQCKFQSIGA